MPLFFTLLKAATKRTGSAVRSTAASRRTPIILWSKKSIVDSIFFATTLISTLLKAATKHTAEKACQARKSSFLRWAQMPNRNNTNAPQNISFRRFCTAVTCQYSVLSALRPHKITRKSFALRCLAVPQCRFLVGARSLPQAILCIVKTNDTATAEIGFAGPCSYCSCSAYRT